MRPYEEYPLIYETETEGFVYGAIIPMEPGREAGAGFIEAPGGARAGLQWERSDTPFIMRIEPPDDSHWGLYRVGFIHPGDSVANLTANLAELVPRLRILHRRARPFH
jgi:hypothetical protein